MDRTNNKTVRVSSGTATVKANKSKSKNWHGKKGMKWGYSHGIPNGNRTAKFPLIIPNSANLEIYVNQWMTTSSKINPDGSISIGGIKNPVYEGRYWLYSKNPKLLNQHLK